MTNNKIMLVDVAIPLFFDLLGTFYLVFSLSNPSVTWRGIRYTVRKGGFIEAAYEENGYEEFEENKLNV